MQIGAGWRHQHLDARLFQPPEAQQLAPDPLQFLLIDGARSGPVQRPAQPIAQGVGRRVGVVRDRRGCRRAEGQEGVVWVRRTAIAVGLRRTLEPDPLVAPFGQKAGRSGQ